MADAMFDGLTTRAVVGAGLALVAIVAVAVGGVAFTVLVATAVLLMSAEWSVMQGISRPFRVLSLVGLAVVGGVAANASAGLAVVVLGAIAGGLGLFMVGFDRRRAPWVTAGLLYCGLPMIALLWLRAHADGGAIVGWLFAVVWATDIAAFLAGRTMGGRRLAPAISPNKTVAGLIGGVVAAAVAGAVVAVIINARWAADTLPVMLAGLGAVLAVIGQAGDLFESWLKRRVGIKDSGTLLPGHGGVLDRLDGLVPVAVVVALIVAVTPPGLWR